MDSFWRGRKSPGLRRRNNKKRLTSDGVGYSVQTLPKSATSTLEFLRTWQFIR
jgi:hypothetical protein